MRHREIGGGTFGLDVEGCGLASKGHVTLPLALGTNPQHKTELEPGALLSKAHHVIFAPSLEPISFSQPGNRTPRSRSRDYNYPCAEPTQLAASVISDRLRLLDQCKNGSCPRWRRQVAAGLAAECEVSSRCCRQQ